MDTPPIPADHLAAMVRAAGLEKTQALFPAMVALAATRARDAGAAIAMPSDPACEPWPPMKAPGVPSGAAR
ncbi:MAG: hypothetical protein KGL12_03950 [Rhodospirillales bacterium]|nr:hypothetical protein [Rhodospirillales bacterium]